MEEAFHGIAARIALLIEAAAVIVAAVGAIETFVALLRLPFAATHGVRKRAWRRFGTWLLIALEFELAADIIRSVIAPTWQEIGELGAIAVIRTFLNFFLEKDLEHADAAAQEG